MSSTTGVKRLKDETLVQVLNKRSEERRILLRKLSETDKEDPIDAFFKSMALTVKRFSAELQIKAKMDVFKIVNELEFQNIRQVYQTDSIADNVFPEKVTPACRLET